MTTTTTSTGDPRRALRLQEQALDADRDVRELSRALFHAEAALACLRAQVSLAPDETTSHALRVAVKLVAHDLAGAKRRAESAAACADAAAAEVDTLTANLWRLDRGEGGVR